MTQTAALDRGVDFQVDRLDEYLKNWLGGSELVRVQRTHGGMSNPTYFVTRGHWRAVLRKQPNNVLMPSAYAIDREYTGFWRLCRAALCRRRSRFAAPTATSSGRRSI
jgi:aminoglycoside phosphotransferase (APT) family kinase protein